MHFPVRLHAQHIPLWWLSVVYLRSGSYLLFHASTEFQKNKALQAFKLQFFTLAFYKLISYEENKFLIFFFAVHKELKHYYIGDK